MGWKGRIDHFSTWLRLAPRFHPGEGDEDVTFLSPETSEIPDHRSFSCSSHNRRRNGKKSRMYRKNSQKKEGYFLTGPESWPILW